MSYLSRNEENFSPHYSAQAQLSIEFRILFSLLLKNVYKEDILDKMRGTHRLNKAAGMETSV